MDMFVVIADSSKSPVDDALRDGSLGNQREHGLKSGHGRCQMIMKEKGGLLLCSPLFSVLRRYKRDSTRHRIVTKSLEKPYFKGLTNN